ncbi:MAG: hypothetical protein JSW54_12470 [Fidelibacterota bacterium]|nr:MAG: hypothetical protein JSW54_12470 [Candidatus Neomarinimicrobiota bacterium]
MKRLLLLPLLIWLACAVPDPTEPEADLAEHGLGLAESVPFGEPFSIAYGESQLVGEEGLEVEFQQVLQESRCPLDVDCIWEGQARIRLSLVDLDQDTLNLEPFIYGFISKDDTAGHQRVFSEEYNITLMQLDPYPTADTVQPDPQDYTAMISVALNPVPLVQDKLILVDYESFQEYVHNPIDGFGIDSVATANDTLLVYAAYSGGCNEHDFFLFGSSGCDASMLSRIQLVILHDGHEDLCDAWLHRTLRFDLSPIRESQRYGNPVSLDIHNTQTSILYTY